MDRRAKQYVFSPLYGSEDDTDECILPESLTSVISRAPPSPFPSEEQQLTFPLASSLVLFILANWWFFSSSTCHATSPRLYFTTLAGLIISWIYVCEVVLIVLGLLFFLPLVLVRLSSTANSKSSFASLQLNRS